MATEQAVDLTWTTEIPKRPAPVISALAREYAAELREGSHPPPQDRILTVVSAKYRALSPQERHVRIATPSWTAFLAMEFLLFT